MAKSKSRYYGLAKVVTGLERERQLRYWKNPELEKLVLTEASIGFIPEERRQVSLAFFEAAVSRFGPAWEGGCFCSITRGQQRWDDCGGSKCASQIEHSSMIHIFDHATFFQRPGESINAVIGQPYDYIESKHRPVLEALAAERGLSFEVGAGWHFPERTPALIFRRP